MDLRTRLIASAFRSLGNNNKTFDIDAFVKRVILFQTYIIISEGLEEIPHLVRIFGFDGLLQIFEEEIVKLNCFYKMTASLGPTFFINEPLSSKVRPPLHFSFAETSTGNLYHNINLSLRRIEPKMDLSPRQLIRLRKTIYSSLETPQESGGELSLINTKNDLVLSPDLLAKALVIALKNQLGILANYQEIKLDVKYENDHDFHASTNIQKLFNLDILSTHKIVETACLAIAKRNDRIEQMKMYSALSGFNDIDIPIFGDKLAFLASVITPDMDEKRFQRVVELNGLPQINNDSNVRLDSKKLIKLRESPEALEFRHWLTTIDFMSDAEILKQVNSLSKIIGRIIGGETGKAIRFLLTNGAGFIPPPIGSIISMPLSVLDTFVIDKIFPRSGIAAFIGDMYPSLFEKSTHD